MVDVTVPLATEPRRSRRPRWLLGWPMRPLVVIVSAVAIFTVTLASTWGMSGWRYPQWVQTSAALHEQLLFSGSIAAAAACFCAASLCGPRSLLALPGSARSGWRAVTQQCATLTAWFVVAYLLAFVPLLVDTARRATSGGPDLLAMAIGPFGLAALVALGYALGTIVPSPIVAPGAAVLAFVLMQLRPAGNSGLNAIRLVQGNTLRPDLVENPGVSVYRICFLVVLVAALVLVAGAVLRLRARPLGVRARAVAFLVFPIMVAAVPVVTTPTLVIRDAAPPRVCGTTEGVEICLHEAYRNDLPAVSAVASRVLKAAGGPAGVGPILETSLVGPEGRPAGVVQFSLSPLRDINVSVPSDTAIALTGRGACFTARGREGTISGLDQRREAYSSQLTEWVLGQAGFPGAGRKATSDAPGSTGASVAFGTPFADIDPAVVRTWLVEQRADLLRCTLRADRIR